MSNSTPLKTLFNSTRQYHSRKILKADEYISLLSDTLSSLHLTSKIDLTTLSQEIRNYVMILDWFGHISTKTTQFFYDGELHITTIDKDGVKFQLIYGSNLFANLIITEYINDKHQSIFGSSLSELKSKDGINPSKLQAPWHTATLDSGITFTIETISSAQIEYQRYYLNQLSETKSLQTLQNIQKNFNNIHFENTEEALTLQVLEQITELYLEQYAISAILLPYHLGNEEISINIDRIYEAYTDEQRQHLRKIQELIHILNKQGNMGSTPNTEHTTTTIPSQETTEPIKPTELPCEAPTEAVNEPVITQDEESLITEISTSISKPQVQSAETEEKQTTSLDAVISAEQSISISSKKKQNTKNNTSKTYLADDLLAHFCEEKISDTVYRVAGDFYLIQEHNAFTLQKHDGYKTIGKGDEAFELPIYKRVSKTPYFIVARTEHLQAGDQGVALIAIIKDQTTEKINLILGDADSKKVKAVLRNKGILVDSPKMNADYIDSMYQVIEKQLFVSDDIGWVQHAGKFGFVLPNKFGIGISGLEYSEKNPNLRHAIESNGDLEEWLSIFQYLNLEKAHPGIAFLLFSSLLPLFANFHDTFEGFVINITPDYTEGKGSSNGKTALQQLMLSIQGSVEHWHTNWNKTALAMEDYLYTNVGAYFDDTSKTKMKPEELEDLIYSISDAESRGSSRQNVRTRKTVMFSTGEKDFLQHTGKDGAYVRYVDVGIKRNDYGSDDSEVTRKIVDYIKKTVVSHYGFVYPEAIRIFIENKDEILASTDAYIDEMAQYGQYDNASRIAKRYAMIAVCGEIFIESMKRLTGNSNLYDSLNPFNIALNMFKVHDQRLIEMEQAQELVGQSLLVGLLNKFSEDENYTLCDMHGEKVGFVEDNTIYIQSSAVTANLPEGMTNKSLELILTSL